MADLKILIALYPGVTHLDFTGPHQVLCRLPESTLTVASLGGQDIEADGLTFARLADLAAVPSCDVLCIPGGFGTSEAVLNEAFMAEIRRLASGATYLTSVCTGSLILAATGLIRGKRAACHWAWRDLLPAFGVIPDEARVVRDGNLITGGGVTAGIDFAFTLAAELRGEAVAQTIQLGLEYAPAPPFNAGRPETAPAAILKDTTDRMAQMGDARRAAITEAARRLQPA